MDKEYEFKYHKLEENYWWFQSRRQIVLALVNSLNLSKNAKILEIGCSGGPLLSKLKIDGFTNVFGIDISENAIIVCKERKINNTSVMDATNMDFENEAFDLVIASDILEHIENDTLALKEWNRVLKKEGNLIVFVPAYQSLWSQHDEINHHYRRYTKRTLQKELIHNEFYISRSSYWNFSIFVPTFIARKLQRSFKSSSKKSSDQLYVINPVMNRFLIGILKIENNLLQVLKFPFGVSVFAVGKKRNV